MRKYLKKYLLSAIFTLSLTPAFGAVTVNVIDVGYGQAIHVEAGYRHYLFDVGPKESYQDVLQFLSTRKVTRLNGIFLSHTHPDHVGGLIPILSQIQTDVVFWNEMLPPTEEAAIEFDQAEKLAPFKNLLPGSKMNLSRHLKLTVLKMSYTTNNLNDASLVFLLNVKGKKILLTGDAGEDRQVDLVKAEPKNLKKPDLFIWPHHGDFLKPTFQKSLKKVHFCVVSVGENEYGLPRNSFEKQSDQLCKKTYRTDRTGSLIFHVGRGKIKLINEEIKKQ